jgi:hypothetical protein
MHSEAAYERFRTKGEEGYQQFLIEQMRDSLVPEVREWGEQQHRLRMAPSPRALGIVAPSAPQGSPVAAAPRQFRTAAYLYREAAPAPAQPVRVSALTQAFRSPPAVAYRASSLEAAHRLLDIAAEEYALVLARQRMDHGHAMLAAEGRFSPLEARIRRIGATLLDPARLGEYRQAEERTKQAATLTEAYLEHLNAYIEASGASWSQRNALRVARAHDLESRIADLMYQLAETQAGRYQWLRSRVDRARQHVANWWLEGSAMRRVGMIALLPLGLGVGLGLAAASLAAPLPAALAIGGAATWAGGVANGQFARTLNRFQILHPGYQRLIAEESDEVLRDYPAYLQLYTLFTSGRGQTIHSQIAAHQSERNLTHLEGARRFGMFVTALAFGGVEAAAFFAQGNGFGFDQYSATPQHPATAHVTPTVAPVTAPQPVLDPQYDTFPWRVANTYWPGHALDHIRQFIPVYNAHHAGANLALIYHQDTNTWILQQANGQPAAGALRAGFNQEMVAHFMGRHFVAA